VNSNETLNIYFLIFPWHFFDIIQHLPTLPNISQQLPTFIQHHSMSLPSLGIFQMSSYHPKETKIKFKTKLFFLTSLDIFSTLHSISPLSFNIFLVMIIACIVLQHPLIITNNFFHNVLSCLPIIPILPCPLCISSSFHHPYHFPSSDISKLRKLANPKNY